MRLSRIIPLLILTLALFLGLVAGAEEQADARLMEMQARLRELGYFYGECNGWMDETTIIAIENFQTANGLAVTGKADQALENLLKSDKAVSKSEYLENASKGEIYEKSLLPGDSGKYVKKLQTRLSELGYYKGKIDSRYSAETEKAVKLFQLFSDLTVTGVADPETLYALTSPRAVRAEAEQLEFALCYGDEGNDVKQLQLDLSLLGYFTGESSGKFGRKTAEALTSFQKANGLTVTGECDVETALLIRSGQAVTRRQADEVEATKPLILGDDDACVSTVKAQLNALGFYTGEMGSLFTQELAQSVSYFQEANQISATGIADTQTRVRLNAPGAVDMDGYAEIMKTRTSRLGDASYAVTLLQTRMTELGYYSEAITGIFDKATQSAVMYLQKLNMFMENGEADGTVIAFLYDEDALPMAQAEESYYARLEENQRLKLVDSVCETALKCVSAPYESGKTGPNSFGNAGLVYYCFDSIGIRVEPTVMLQLGQAQNRAAWNEDATLVEVGQQVFYRDGENIITGIYVGDRVFVYASAGRGMVIAVENVAEMAGYEFVGSISYF